MRGRGGDQRFSPTPVSAKNVAMFWSCSCFDVTCADTSTELDFPDREVSVLYGDGGWGDGLLFADSLPVVGVIV